jgi:hypothetical protein
MGFYTQKIIANTKTEVILPDFFDSMILSNTDASAAVTIDLYVTEQLGVKLRQAAAYENTTPSKVNLAAGYIVTDSSQAVAIDTTSPSDDIFLNEKVFKSDGTFIGTCTASGGASPITFGGGLEIALVNNDDLYTGARFYILNNVVIPNGASLELTSNETALNPFAYKLYIVSGDADGQIDITIRKTTA